METSSDEEHGLLKISSNEFFSKYVKKAAEDKNVIVSIQRENTFLVQGLLNDIEKFFSAFKVDKDFMEKPDDFVVYSPIFTYGEIKHHMKYDEDYPIGLYGFGPETSHIVDNAARDVVEGRWYSLFEEGENKVKSIKPSEITKYLRALFPKWTKEMEDDVLIFVEFTVDVKGYANTIYDKMSEYSNIENREDANKREDKDDEEDFDYTVPLVKPPNDDDIVKAALKDVDRKFIDVDKEAERKLEQMKNRKK